MNQRDDLDRKLMAWLDDPFTPPAPGYLGEVLELTRHTRQRRAWASLERWLPMTITLRRPMLAPPLRLLALGLALLLALMAAFALAPILSSVTRLPATVTAWSNGLLAFDRSGDIWVVDPSLQDERVLIAGPTVDDNPDWSPDGTRIAFWRAVGQAGALMVADADGSNITQLTTDPVVDPSGFWWSPDGSRIAVVSIVGSDGAISLVDSGGGGVRGLDVGLPVQSVSWRPDGMALLFRSVTPSGAGLYTVDLADGSVDGPILSSDTTSDFFAADHGDNDLYGPLYSPDGSMVAWSNGVVLPAGHAPRSFPYSRSYVANADGSGVRSLEYSATSDDEDGVAWSPDGTRLSMHLRTGDDDQIAIVGVDGSQAVLITEANANPGSWLTHLWSPDGTQIITSRGGDGRTTLIDTHTAGSTALTWVGHPSDWQPVAVQP